MFVLSITKMKHHHYEIQIDGVFQRFIKAEDFPALANELGKAGFYLQNEDSSTNPDKFTLEISSDQEEEIKKLILVGRNKKQIDLPYLVNKSVENKLVIYSYRDLTPYKQYWLKGDGHISTQLLKSLSEDLIEIPYVDEPEDYIISHEIRAYHVNHGTTHGLRQREFLKKFVELVKEKGIIKWKAVAHDFSLEERACLELAMFLYRSGRTNEKEWYDDSSYGHRSGNIFKQVAEDLGFKKNIIKAIAEYCFDYHKEIDFEFTLPGSNIDASRLKAKLFQVLMRLSHNLDLIRCTFDLDSEVKVDIEKDLKILLDNPEDISNTLHAFLVYAAYLCFVTGSPVMPENLRKISDAQMQGNTSKAVKSVKNIEETLLQFMAYQPENLTPLQKLRIDDFCNLFPSQITTLDSLKVLDQVKIENDDELERLIQKLNTHPAWRLEQNDELRELYQRQKLNNQLPSLKSLCQAKLFYQTPLSDFHFQNSVRHSHLFHQRIESKRKLSHVSQKNDDPIYFAQEKRKAPTSLWLNTHRHSWTGEEAKKIPTDQCIQVENEYLYSHVPLYHATKRYNYILDVFCRTLVSFGLHGSTSGLGNIPWVRHMYSMPPNQAKIKTDIEKFREGMKENLSKTDNDEILQWHLLSCSPSLWQNTDYDAMESTVDYFYENNSVADLDFKTIFNNILDSVGLLIDNKQQREKIFKQLMQAAEAPDLGAQGIIYQFLIPWNVVNKMAYISGKNGVYDIQNPNTLETLIRLQSSDNKPENDETLQIRLFVPALLNPEYTKNIIVKNYSNAPTEAWEKLHRSIYNCAHQVLLSQSKAPTSPDQNNSRFKFSQIGASTKVLEANTARDNEKASVLRK